MPYELEGVEVRRSIRRGVMSTFKGIEEGVPPGDLERG